MATKSPDERFLVNSDERCYSFTDSTFIKRERPRKDRPVNTYTDWKPRRGSMAAGGLPK